MVTERDKQLSMKSNIPLYTVKKYFLEQGGHCPGNQEKVRENDKWLRLSGESQGTLTGCPDLKVLPLLSFNLMISVSNQCYIKKLWTIF